MEQVRMTSPQGTQGTHATRGKPSAQGADQGAGAQAAGPGGFLSLLAALGDGGLQDPLAAQAGVLETGLAGADDPAAVDAAAADAAALAALQGGFLPWQVPDAGAAATAPTVGGFAAGQGGMSHGLGQSLLGGLLPTDGLVAQTALLDRAAEALPDSGAATGAPGSLLAPPAGGLRRMQSRIPGAVQSGDAAAVAGAPSSGLAGARGHAATPSLQAGAAQLPPVERRDMAAASREAVPSMAQDTVATLAPLLPGVVEGLPGARALAQGAEPGARDPAAGAAGTASYEPQGGGAVEGATVFIDPAMATAPAEDAVAEQVAFWVHQNIQNAEVTVKHDGKPVEVSVSLTGNEAHVAFRSDQAQTRDLLDASVSQLREMLRQEGLELSGVTVGDSGAQAGEGGSQRGQQGAPRNVQVAVPAEAGTRTRSGVDILSDRAVDLFV